MPLNYIEVPVQHANTVTGTGRGSKVSHNSAGSVGLLYDVPSIVFVGSVLVFA